VRSRISEIKIISDTFLTVETECFGEREERPRKGDWLRIYRHPNQPHARQLQLATSPRGKSSAQGASLASTGTVFHQRSKFSVGGTHHASKSQHLRRRDKSCIIGATLPSMGKLLNQRVNSSGEGADLGRGDKSFLETHFISRGSPSHRTNLARSDVVHQGDKHRNSGHISSLRNNKNRRGHLGEKQSPNASQ
jgi:hypothetical protein